MQLLEMPGRYFDLFNAGDQLTHMHDQFSMLDHGDVFVFVCS